MRLHFSEQAMLFVLALVTALLLVATPQPLWADEGNPQEYADSTDRPLDLATYCRYFRSSVYCAPPVSADDGAPQVFHVYFAPGDDTVGLDEEPGLRSALAAATLQPEAHIAITGHADNGSREEDAMNLSVRRAAAVGAWFKENGIDGERISLSGAGASHPLLPARDDSGENLNRRAEVLLDIF